MTSAELPVVVVGGGVVGAACAHYLAKAGRRVLVLDRGRFGDGCSHANCGYVCPSHVLPLAVPGAIGSTLKTLLSRNSPLKLRPGVILRDPRWFRAFARRCTERHALAAGRGIQALLNSSRTLFDELIAEERLDCGWETKGLLFVFRTAAAMVHHAAADDALKLHFGVASRRFNSVDLCALEPALRPDLAGGWLYEADAHLRPDRLMATWRQSLERRGVEVREGCELTGFAQDLDGRAKQLRTSAGNIDIDAVVIATGAWTPLLRKQLGCRVPIQPGKGYSVTLPRPANCPTYPMIFEEHRVAVTPFADGLRVGSTMEFAGYDESLDPRRLALLTTGAALYLKDPPPPGPAADGWWGWRPMTPDGLPLIGPTPRFTNVWLAAGHNMLGLSMAPATGKLVAELVTGRPPHLDPTPYAVGRF